MQQHLRPFDGNEPTYTAEDFLNAITANMIITAGPEQADSPHQEAWILKRIASWQALCREFQKTFDNQKSQTKAKLLLERITSASGKLTEILALRIEQIL